MKEIEFILKSSKIFTKDGMKAGQLLMSGRKILAIEAPGEDQNPLAPILDVGDLPVFPGLIDCHVHINEPGRTEWEGFETATRAAASGGITSMIEMPLNSDPVTTTGENFDVKIKAAQGKLHVNCGFWGGVVPDNIFQLEEMLDRGVFGLKAFLTHSGIDDFPNTTEIHLKPALQILKKYNRPLLVHCELESANDPSSLLSAHPTSYQAYLGSRPKSWENDAIELVIRLCRETGARVHIVHLSSAKALPAIRKAKADGIPLTVETCPHYLVFHSALIGDGQTQYKCAPPIREKENNDLLWEALMDGTIDFLGSDHSPAPPEMKETQTGNFQKAWGGIAGLQFLLSAFWTEARKRGFTLEQVVKLLSTHPAAFAGLEKRKGQLSAGFDADLFCWDPDASFTVTSESIQHRHKVCPYLGMELVGKVQQCFVSGKEVFNSGRFIHLAQGNVLYPY